MNFAWHIMMTKGGGEDESLNTGAEDILSKMLP